MCLLISRWIMHCLLKLARTRGGIRAVSSWLACFSERDEWGQH